MTVGVSLIYARAMFATNSCATVVSVGVSLIYARALFATNSCATTAYPSIFSWESTT